MIVSVEKASEIIRERCRQAGNSQYSRRECCSRLSKRVGPLRSAGRSFTGMIVSVEKASEIIRGGGLVAIPTETVYGLAADASNAIAVQKTFNLKGRPADNPLIIHISSIDQVETFASDFPEYAKQLAERFWPGPLTMVLKRKPEVLDLVTAGLDTVALRMPDHPASLELITMSGPVTAPSARLPAQTDPVYQVLHNQHISRTISARISPF